MVIVRSMLRSTIAAPSVIETGVVYGKHRVRRLVARHTFRLQRHEKNWCAGIFLSSDFTAGLLDYGMCNLAL